MSPKSDPSGRARSPSGPPSADDLEAMCLAHGPVSECGHFPDGTLFGDWRLTAFIGHGGNGEVYCAEHALLGTSAAVKVLMRDDERAKARFAREAQLLARLRSDVFPRFFAYGEANGYPYLAMELLAPGELPADDRAVARFMLRVCDAVAELHAQGLVHRDIKPSNILWRTVGSRVPRDCGRAGRASLPSSVPVLADLGLVKDIATSDGGHPASDITLGGVGTPGYGAPEQMERGEATVASDIHALGVLADRCFGGRPPSAWKHIVRRATSSLPTYRYSSVVGFVRAIRLRHLWRNVFWTVCAACLAMAACLAGPAVSRLVRERLAARSEADIDALASYAVASTNLPEYCVLDISAGPNAAHYPVTWLKEAPAGGWTDEYKTRKLVLRRIGPGCFTRRDKRGAPCKIVLSRPFYLGVFEVTQLQWELVMDMNPSQMLGQKRPVDSASYDLIRGSKEGSGWPASDAVDADSFIGRLRARIGPGFDLPTEMQCEYACRAGTTSRYNNGSDVEDGLKLLGRYKGNRRDGKRPTEHVAVGSYLPNAWGLYDMHGNVCEYCLDYFGDGDWNAKCQTTLIDPKGRETGNTRIVRGGHWDGEGSMCASGSKGHFFPSATYCISGFRLCLNLVDGVKIPSVADL